MWNILPLDRAIKLAIMSGLLAAITLVARSNVNKLTELFPDGSARGLTVTEVFAENIIQTNQVLGDYKVPAPGELPSDGDNGGN